MKTLLEHVSSLVTIYILGGEPFVEERFIDWNFVSTSEELIEEAKQKSKTQSFPKIEGDEIEYIPYPSISQYKIINPSGWKVGN